MNSMSGMDHRHPVEHAAAAPPFAGGGRHQCLGGGGGKGSAGHRDTPRVHGVLLDGAPGASKPPSPCRCPLPRVDCDPVGQGRRAFEPLFMLGFKLRCINGSNAGFMRGSNKLMECRLFSCLFFLPFPTIQPMKVSGRCLCGRTNTAEYPVYCVKPEQGLGCNGFCSSG
jgi:hypothetical protein